MAQIAYLESARSRNRIAADTPQTLDPATGESLFVRYDMEALKRTAKRENPAKHAAESVASLGMWRYRDVLPDVTPVTLGEGWTPLLQSRRYPGLSIKEEGNNPTGSFKARGLGLAVTLAKHYGVQHLALASAGNAGGALAAYAAAAGMTAHIYMPQDAPFANYMEAVLYGADLHLVKGTIADCARVMMDEIQKLAGLPLNERWFDVSSLREPFRVEGKKTMGYELAEQLGWRYPDAIFYPTGSGVGLIGMAKAFDEMEELGWMERGTKRPQMFALKAEGSAGLAAGLQAHKPLGEGLIHDIVTQSGGRAIASSDEEILASLRDFARHEGIFLSPEGAAATAAYSRMVAAGELSPEEKVVVFNTASGLKYAGTTARAMRMRQPGSLPASLPVGGIITPV